MGSTNTFRAKRQKNGLFPSVLKALGLTVFFAFLLLAACAVIASRLSDPSRFVRPMAYGALAAASLLCGVFAARLCRGSFLAGLLAGGFFAVLLFLLSLVLRVESALPFPVSLLFFPAVALLAGLGGAIGRRRAPRRRHLRR